MKGLAQDELARKPDIPHAMLTKIESDVVVKPGVQTVARIAKALDVPTEELIK